MWGEGLLSRATRKAAIFAAGSALERAAERFRAAGAEGLIEVVLPDGARVSFGTAPRLVLTVKDASALAALASPTLGALAEAYVEGRIDFDGDMGEVMDIADRFVAIAGSPATARGTLVAARHQPAQDRADIRHHYDVGNDFYRLWLDEAMVYSCAYFRHPDDALEQAQRNKLDHICRKLRLAPGERFLDVGCGWGALVLHAAREYGVRAVGITLSEQQHALARERIAAAGLSDRAEVLLLDYRDLPARFGEASFDKAASVGMFEHVGLNNLPLYFGVLARILRDRGLLLNHGITSADVDSRPVGSGAGEFIGKYVFPNGELPHLHVKVREMSAHGFEVFDVESLRPHYALTLQQWSERLEARLAEAARCAGERTLRIWRVYLAGSAHGFAQGWMNIYQVLASRQDARGLTALPLTRDWIYRD